MVGGTRITVITSLKTARISGGEYKAVGGNISYELPTPNQSDENGMQFLVLITVVN